MGNRLDFIVYGFMDKKMQHVFFHFELQAQDWQALLRDSGHFA